MNAMPAPPDVFALLDDAQATADGGVAASRLYLGHERTHTCDDPATLADCWAAAQRDLAAGLHAVVLADYEWGARLQRAGLPVAAPGALRLLMFRELRWLDEAGVHAFLQQLDGGAPTPNPAGVLDLHADVDDAGFHAAIAAIHEAIRRGEVYQVNYTHRLNGRAFGSPAALYRRLRARQRVGYGAFIALPPSARQGAITHVLSCSPELFLAGRCGEVTARPMKGTAARRTDPADDAAAAQALQRDAKNRAENVMIVDLLRNDLGRIAVTGGVQVPALFSLERYATVWQMTSTVRARLRPQVDFPALLRATFPCGSITGAPKLAAMDRIRSLEAQPRGLYCGAIGWIAPAPGPALGDFALSVAIRTLTLAAEAADGTRALVAGVGAGIVLDSVATDEAEECRIKARFLTGIDPGLGLFETLRAEAGPDSGGRAVALHVEQHLARMAHSARALGFAFDAAAARALIDRELAALAASGSAGPWRLRLDLAHDGRLTLRSAPLPPLAADAHGRVRLGWADTLLPAANALAAHKTTHRAVYDAAVRDAEAQGLFDLLFVNAAGRVVEGGRSTLFVRLDGRWFTPPLADGALPGTCRARVLAQGLDGAPVAQRPLTVDEVLHAQAWAVGNALRGVVPAQVTAHGLRAVRQAFDRR